jgi:hypothetical protein
VLLAVPPGPPLGADPDLARAVPERQVRQILTEINEKIAEAVRRPPEGPPPGLAPFDVENAVSQGRERPEAAGGTYTGGSRVIGKGERRDER